MVFDAIGGLIVGIIALLLLDFNVNTNIYGALFGILTGLCGLGGALF